MLKQMHLRHFSSLRKLFDQNSPRILPSTRNLSQTINQEEVLFESRNNKELIIINRPSSLNAVNLSGAQNVLAKVQECERSKSMIIIRGQGKKAFSSGSNPRLTHESVESGRSAYFEAFQTLSEIYLKIYNLKIPYISIVNGIAMGNGFTLGNLGKYNVATEKAVMGLPEVSLGAAPAPGCGYIFHRLRRSKVVGSKLGLYLALTGDKIRGSDTLRAGLAKYMCSMDKLDDLQEELLTMDNSKAGQPEEIQKILQHYTDICPESKNPFSLEDKLSLIDELFHAPSVEDIIDNLEKDSSDWAITVLDRINQMSPTALKITYKYFQRTKEMSLKECLNLDYRLFVRCFKGPDFREGVRAFLVDTDQEPSWNPSTLSGVTEAYVESFF